MISHSSMPMTQSLGIKPSLLLTSRVKFLANMFARRSKIHAHSHFLTLVDFSLQTCMCLAKSKPCLKPYLPENLVVLFPSFFSSVSNSSSSSSSSLFFFVSFFMFFFLNHFNLGNMQKRVKANVETIHSIHHCPHICLLSILLPKFELLNSEIATTIVPT